MQIASDRAQEKIAQNDEEDEKRESETSQVEEENKTETNETSEEAELSVNELVSCLFEGNISGVEQYLQSLPSEKREEVHTIVWNQFAAQMKTRGFDDSSNKPLSPRSGSKLHQVSKVPSFPSSSPSSIIIDWAVNCLILGNTLALEEYLESLKPEAREKMRREIQNAYETVVKKSTLRLMRTSFKKKTQSLSSLPPPPAEEQIVPPLENIDDIAPPD